MCQASSSMPRPVTSGQFALASHPPRNMQGQMWDWEDSKALIDDQTAQERPPIDRAAFSVPREFGGPQGIRTLE